MTHIHKHTYMGEGNGTTLQYSCLEIPWMEEPGRLQSMGSLGVGHNWATSLSIFTFMLWRRKRTHSSVLAWRIPGKGEPGRLPSTGSHRVGHDWSDLAAAAAAVAAAYSSGWESFYKILCHILNISKSQFSYCSSCFL